MICTLLLLITTIDDCVLAKDKLLLVSFDGLKWDYADRRPDLKSFKYLKENGVTSEYLIPAFPTLTSPAHMTIATGLYAESHGVVHNVDYNRSDGSPVDGDFYSTLTHNYWWDSDYEPIWITASSQGLKSGGYLYPGSNATIGGKTATRSILETESTPLAEADWKTRIDDVMSWFIDDNFDFVALYFEEPDGTGHSWGPDHPRITLEALPLVDRTIGYMLDKTKKVGLENVLNIIIVSDHGMTEINTTLSGNDVISTLDYVNASDVFFQFPYTALGLIEPYPDKMEKVYGQLKDAKMPMKVYYKEEIPERLHYARNERVTSIVILADPGYVVYSRFPGTHESSGTHGYDNIESDMRASFYAIGPAFQKNLKIPGFESVHLYELMCHILELTPAPNNGSFDVLSIALNGANSKHKFYSLLLVASQVAFWFFK